MSSIILLWVLQRKGSSTRWQQSRGLLEVIVTSILSNRSSLNKKRDVRSVLLVYTTLLNRNFTEIQFAYSLVRRDDISTFLEVIRPGIYSSK